MSNYWKAQKREGVKEIFPSMATVQKPGGGRFIKPGSLKGQKTVSQVKLDAAKAKLEAAKFNLNQTFKKSDKVLNKLKTTVKKQKKILEE
tara:strand:+ start:43 stop:312 length:270 start_codon:yes stop_codon:yes gene_type:complete